MGFTRYWKRVKEDYDDEILTKVKRIVGAAEEEGIKVCGWDGYGEPRIDLTEISLNGDAERGLSCETFYIENGKSYGIYRECCKTQRQPYDAVVNAILQVMEDAGILEAESDGECMEEEAKTLLGRA